jgi:hypothetical protein
VSVVNFIGAVFNLALTVFAGVWENVLKPAIETVWNFLQNSVFPLFESIANFISAVFELAITVFAGVWENVLLPAIQAVSDWVSEKLQPIFEALGDFWENTLLPIIEDVASWLNEKLSPAFDWLGGILDSVTGFFNDLAEGLNGLKDKLPDWLTPGSPTPLEIGLRGVHKILKTINKEGLPDFNEKLNNFEAPNIGLRQPSMKNISEIGGGGQQIIKNYNFNANYEYQSPLSLMDEVRLREAAGV